MLIRPNSKEIDKILNNLTNYPVVKVNPITAQAFGRHKKIRYLSKNENIYIKKGIISIPNTVQIKKKNNGYDFLFR